MSIGKYNEIRAWQSCVFQDTFRGTRGEAISGGFYELHFDPRTPDHFTVRLSPECHLTESSFTLFLREGHSKAGYQSISEARCLAPVAEVAAQREDSEGFKVFTIFLRHQAYEDKPLIENFEQVAYNQSSEKKLS